MKLVYKDKFLANDTNKIVYMFESEIEHELKTGATYNVDKERKKRSLDANAYFHVLVSELSKYYETSLEEMKIKMNLEYGEIATDEHGKLGCKVPKGMDISQFYKYAKWYKEDVDGCDCYLFFKETHTLNSKEFARLINGVVQECREVGIETLEDIEINALLENYNIK